MGNTSSAPPVAPSSSPVPPLVPEPSPPAATPPTPVSQTADAGLAAIAAQAQEAAKQPVERPNNPGTYEELHKKCKEILPMVFEGGKVVIGKGLSSHFQINHTLMLGSSQMSGYRFGATYVGTKQFSPQESYPILLGDINADGNLNANIIHGFSRNLITRCVAQFQDDKMNTQLVTDYKGESYTGSLTVANPDILNGSGLLVSQYLQRVTPSLDLGAECMYQRAAHMPGGQIAVMSLAGRLQGEKWQLAATLSPGGPTGGGVHASYYQRVSDTLQVCSEFETSVGMGESSATVGYQLEIPNAGVTFKGQFDTNWTVQATMEKKLMESQLPFTFLLSAMGNQTKSDYSFGVGMMLG